MVFSKMFRKKIELYVSGSNHGLYPAEVFTGHIFFEDGSNTYIPVSYSFSPRWGDASSMHLLNNGNRHGVPEYIEVAWYSIVENKFYGLRSDLPKEKIRELLKKKDPETGEHIYYYIVVGMAPYGGLAIWLAGSGQTVEVAWFHCEPADIDISEYEIAGKMTGEEYAAEALQSHRKAYDNFHKNGLPARDLFDRYMDKFEYRLLVEFEDAEPEYEIETLWCYNGEVKPYGMENVGRYMPRGKPYRILVTWTDGEDKYHGYFWTHEKNIITSFADFFRDRQRGDFVISISGNYTEYSFGLRDGDKYLEIPSEEREILIFKNNVEYGRHSYNREPEGWRH